MLLQIEHILARSQTFNQAEATFRRWPDQMWSYLWSIIHAYLVFLVHHYSFSLFLCDLCALLAFLGHVCH